ncbi:MAG: hypothetical protein ACTJFR_02675 [Canibacter sp.]
MSNDPQTRSLFVTNLKLKRLSYDDFAEQYDIQELASRVEEGTTALFGALKNSSVVDRIKIAHALLDAGADATTVNKSENANVFHILFSGRNHDGELELPLVKRLVEAGADINCAAKKFGMPAQMFLTGSTVKEDNYSQVFDYFFTLDELDLFKKNRAGYSTYRTFTNAANSNPIYAGLKARMDQFIESRGITIPDDA